MSTKSFGTSASGSPPVYPTKPLQAHVDDGYKMRGKPAEPSVCGECGVVFHGGRGSWAAKPANAHDILCPACHRIRDAAPAGYLTLEGKFVAEHRDDLRHVLHSVESKEKAEHPLQRIMEIKEGSETINVTTTDVHLVRAMGEALHRAYHGELEFKYGEDENMVRAHWKR